MDAHVQSLLHHLWPSPAAIRARLPRFSAPGFTAGQHNDASVFASCYSLQSCSPLDQVTPYDVRGFYIRAFPTSGHTEAKSDITTQPTGLLLRSDFHPLAECFCGLHRLPDVKLLFSF